jgi:hypothetical protein
MLACLLLSPANLWAQARPPQADAAPPSQPETRAEAGEPEKRSFLTEGELPTLEFAKTPPATEQENEQDELPPEAADPDVVTVLGAATPSTTGLEFRLAAAFALPAFTDLSDTYDAGYQFGLELNFRLQRLFLGGAFYHSGLFFRRESLLEDQSVRQATQNAPPDPLSPVRVKAQGGTLLLFEILGLARYELTDRAFRPYVLGGGGVTLSQPTDLTGSVTLGENNVVTVRRQEDLGVGPTATVGFGITEKLGPFDLFAQVRGSLLFLDEIGFLTSISIGAAVSP